MEPVNPFIHVIVLPGDTQPLATTIFDFLRDNLPADRVPLLTKAVIRVFSASDYIHAMMLLDNYQIPLATIFTRMPADASFPIFVLK